MLELVLLAAFFVTLGALAGRLFAPRWLVLWVLVAVGTLAPLLMYRPPGRAGAGSPVLAGGLVLGEWRSGSVPALGAGGRGFESPLPDGIYLV